MNTGTHDVVSLGWRLAGVLNGWYKPEVLANYSNERHAVADHLIENDKTVSAFISGHKPERFTNRKEDPMTLLDEFFQAEVSSRDHQLTGQLLTALAGRFHLG